MRPPPFPLRSPVKTAVPAEPAHVPHASPATVDGPLIRPTLASLPGPPSATLAIAPRLTSLPCAAGGIPIQRKIVEETHGKRENRGKYYSTKYDNRYFNTREEAEAHERKQDARYHRDKEAKRERQREKTRQEHARRLREYSPLDASMLTKARLFKRHDDDHDDVDFIQTTPKSVKKTMERALLERRTTDFKPRIYKLGSGTHVLDPGTDVKGTPADYRPELNARSEGLHAFSRAGQAKTYPEVIKAHGLDRADEALADDESEETKTVTRIRMGKDLDRMTRGNSPDGTLNYTDTHLAGMRELAFILRLDKARVPKATKAIRRNLTSGLSLGALFKDEQYPGAGTGGVERLRGLQEWRGDLSEGSDIERGRTTDKSRSRSRAAGHRYTLRSSRKNPGLKYTSSDEDTR